MKTTSKKNDYSVFIEVNGTEYNGKGETLLEALNAVEMEKQIYKTHGVIVASKGKLKSVNRMTPFQMRKIATNKYAREIWAHRFERGLK